MQKSSTATQSEQVEPSGHKKNHTSEQAGSTPGMQGRHSAAKPAAKQRLPHELAREGEACDRTDSEERYLTKTQHLLTISTLNKLLMRSLDHLSNKRLQTLRPASFSVQGCTAPESGSRQECPLPPLPTARPRSHR